MKKALVLALLALCVCLVNVAYAGDKDAAVAVVNAVEKYCAEHGKEAAVAEMMKPAAENAFKEFAPLYAFAYDTDYNMLAHFKNKLVGKNYEKLPDVKGKFFRKDIVDLAKSKGEGWVDYWYKNPADGKLSEKTTYLKMIDGMVVCCGVYK